MKHSEKTHLLSPMFLLLAVVGCALRYRLYQVAWDEKGLLASRHPLELCLWLCSAGALVLLGLLVSGEKAPSRSPGVLSALGNILAASGILLTVLANRDALPALFGSLWLFSGLLAAAMLLYAAFSLCLRRQPSFLTYVTACLFFALHLVGHYRTWCSEPQLQNYLFAFLGAMALMLYCYGCSAARLGRGKGRVRLFWGLAAIYCGIVTLARTGYPWLYLGCSLWVAFSLFTGKEAGENGAS